MKNISLKHKGLAIVLAGVMSFGALTLSAAPVYAASHTSVSDHRGEPPRDNGRHDNDRHDNGQPPRDNGRYDNDRHDNGQPPKDNGRHDNGRYEPPKDNGHDYEPSHRQHPPEEKKKSSSKNTKSQGDVNTAAIVGAIIGAVIAKNT